jgi:hypothetical protein
MRERRRATSVKEYEELGRLMFAPVDGAPDAPEFLLRDDDIVIMPYSKSGTTWLQQIFHTLRTRGDMDFDDISRVVPWIEVNPSLGLDLNAEQRASPRGFKSHLSFDKIPKGGRYINAIRHPNDVAYSLFKFMEGWFIEPGTVTADEFVINHFLQSGTYYEHLLSWWPERSSENVLYLVYEHMNADLEGTIRKVANFVNIDLDEELLTIVMNNASFSFMQSHKDRFDDAMLRAKTEEIYLPAGSDSAKVREGKVNAHRLSPSVLEALDEKWRAVVQPILGFDAYEALTDCK